MLLAIHLLLRIQYGDVKTGLDAVALGLTAIGLSPWIARILESFKFGGVEFKFIRQEVEKQRTELDAIKFLISSLVSKYELDHLKNLANKTPFIIDKYSYPENFQRELRHMRDLGLIDNNPGKGVGVMYSHQSRFEDVHNFFHITEAGTKYLRACLKSPHPSPTAGFRIRQPPFIPGTGDDPICPRADLRGCQKEGPPWVDSGPSPGPAWTRTLRRFQTFAYEMEAPWSGPSGWRWSCNA